MERGILTQEYRHEPVMLGEVLESLRLKSGSVVCDCTLGGAGHSVKMAAQVGETGLLLGVDQDDMALEAAGARLDREVPGVPHQLLKGNFGDLDELICSARCPGSMASCSIWAFRHRNSISLAGAFRITRTPHWTCGWIRVITP